MAANDEPILNPVTPPTPVAYRLNGAEVHIFVPTLDASDVIIGQELVVLTTPDAMRLSAADRNTVVSAARIILRAKGRIAP